MTQSAATRLHALGDRLIAQYVRMHPTLATFLGIHEYDHQLMDFSPGRYEQEVRLCRELIAELQSIPAAELELSDRIDLEMALVSLADELWELTESRPHTRRPDLPLGEALGGCFVLIVREVRPLAERAQNLLGRLRQVPRVLRQGRELLEGSAPVWTQITLAQARGGVGFFRHMVPAFAGGVPELAAELNQAAEQAAAATEEYAAFLEQDLLPRSTASFALGRERFDWRLRHVYKLPYDAASLHARGREMVQETLAQLEEMARRIDPSSTWQEILRRVDDHPPADRLLEVYREVTADARRFVVENGVLDLPPGDELQLMETPPFLRPQLAYAAYSQPGIFEQRQQGLFYVTPVNTSASPEAQAEQLRHHTYANIKTTVLHESYPGHHVQLSWHNQHPSRLRRLLSANNTLFMEGWTLYCEQLMDELGWLATPEEKLSRLKDQLWRACRVVVDSGLHALGMSVEAAEEMLANVAGLDRQAAATEVRGYYCFSPMVPMTYLIGKQELMRLKEDYRRARGPSFSLKEFHMELLSHASIPFAYLREIMLGE